MTNDIKKRKTRLLTLDFINFEHIDPTTRADVMKPYYVFSYQLKLMKYPGRL